MKKVKKVFRGFVQRLFTDEHLAIKFTIVNILILLLLTVLYKAV